MKVGGTPVVATASLDRRHYLSAAAGYGTLAVVFLVIGILYFSSARDLYATWTGSVSYNHCLLVFPVTIWFLWRLRGEIHAAPFEPWPFALNFVFAASLVWLAGALGDLKSLRDLALVLFVPSILSCLLGKRFFSAALFPLAFTIFAWPFGEIFVPIMMDWTADFTIAALRATSVPVFREGNNFVIPTGEWSVVEECSGIRYLMASLSAGAFYAYLNFRSSARRAVFIGIALVVPIVANWFRAYFTVLLGHLSDNTIAVGFDHLVYGWVFFGFVMFGVFMIGARMADGPPELPSVTLGGTPQFSRTLFPFAGAVILVALTGPAWSAWSATRDARTFASGATELRSPASLGDWFLETQENLGDGPSFPSGPVTLAARYSSPAGWVGMHVAAGSGRDAGNTIFSYSSTARFVSDRRWHLVSERTASTREAMGNAVLERVVTDGRRRLLLWQWYRVGALTTASLARAKAEVAASRLIGAEQPGVVVVLFTELADDRAAASAALLEFRGAMSPVLESWIER